MQEKYNIYLPFIVFWVGQRCTMHCKHCCNLIPYYNQRLYDMEKSLQALELLLQVASVGKIQIQGGEPLTHPRIVEYVERIAQLPIAEIAMTTNGTIPFSDELLHVLQQYPHVHITVSNYEVRKEVRNHVINQLQNHGISYTLYDFLYGNGAWFNSGGFDEVRNENDEEVQRSYDQCANKICWTLADGKLAVCGKIITLSQYHNINHHDAHNIIDFSLFNNDGGGVKLQESLIAFIYNSQFFKEVCRYCLGTEQKTTPAIQLTTQEIASYSSLRRGR